LTSFKAGLDAAPAAGFVNVLVTLTSGGAFYLDRGLMTQIAGGTLAAGNHTLHLQATDAQGHLANFDLNFTLQNTAPTVPTLHLDSTSDPKGTGTTTSKVVSLQGQTSAGVQVALMQKGTTIGTT